MIAIDARMIDMSGIGSYIKNLVNNFEYGLIIAKNLEFDYKNNAMIIPFDEKIYSIREQLNFPRKIVKKNVKLLHCPHYNIPIFYKGPIITTIHDIIHLKFPEFLPSKKAKIYAKYMLKKALKKSKAIITVSEHTKKDLIEMFKVDEKKIKVVYNGIDKDFKVLDRNECEYLNEKYNIKKETRKLIYVGNIKKHKNLKGLLLSFSKLKTTNTVLFLIGSSFQNYTEIDEIIKNNKLEDKVIRTGFITKKELIELYNFADLFVFPSLYEGFGYPVLEAMACGLPVISSNTSSLPEVYGDAALAVDPYNIEQMANAIDVMLADDEMRKKYTELGFKRVELFSIEKFHHDTAKVYSDVIQKLNKK